LAREVLLAGTNLGAQVRVGVDGLNISVPADSDRSVAAGMNPALVLVRKRLSPD
jgi:hypothetical protein